jgi:hypothetical protein
MSSAPLFGGRRAGWIGEDPVVQMLGLDRRSAGRRSRRDFDSSSGSGCETATEYGEFGDLDEVRVTPQPARVQDPRSGWTSSFPMTRSRGPEASLEPKPAPLRGSQDRRPLDAPDLLSVPQRQLDSEQLSQGWQSTPEPHPRPGATQAASRLSPPINDDEGQLAIIARELRPRLTQR